MATLVLMTAATAEPLPLEVSGARLGYDQRTGQPVLNITVMGVSKQALYYFSLNNIARKMELRIDGKAILTTVIREPLADGSSQITGRDLDADRIHALAEELSKPGIRMDMDIVPD